MIDAAIAVMVMVILTVGVRLTVKVKRMVVVASGEHSPRRNSSFKDQN